MKSTEIVILAPISCAAAMIGHTEGALRQTAERCQTAEINEMLHDMCLHLRNALAELDAMRTLYDKHLA